MSSDVHRFLITGLTFLTGAIFGLTKATASEPEYHRIDRTGSNKLKIVRDRYGSIPDLDRIFKEHRHTNGLPYHVYIPPALKPGESYPLVMFLHGHTDLTLDTHKGFPKGVWTLPGIQKQHPHLVFVPRHQTKENCWNDKGYHTLTMNALNDFIDQQNSIPSAPRIDRKRIYITGFSKGGAGTWYFIQQQPDYFAAAVPLAGARQGPKTVDEAARIKDLPIWIFNGDPEDRSAMSRMSYESLKKAGANNLRFHEYLHRGHVIDDFAYFTPGFFEWLFAQQR